MSAIASPPPAAATSAVVMALLPLMAVVLVTRRVAPSKPYGQHIVQSFVLYLWPLFISPCRLYRLVATEAV
jgi:hypothetical protein